MIRSNFESWIQTLFARGLVDLKLTVCHSAGISDEAIMAEFLEAERAIELGELRPAPRATSDLPCDIRNLINQVTCT